MPNVLIRTPGSPMPRSLPASSRTKRCSSRCGAWWDGVERGAGVRRAAPGAAGQTPTSGTRPGEDEALKRTRRRRVTVCIITPCEPFTFHRALAALRCRRDLAAGPRQAQQRPASAQPPAAPAAGCAASGRRPRQAATVIRRTFDVVTSDVIVRDNKGQFIANLKKDDFEVFEDGVKQEVISFLLTHGGRVYNEAAPPPPPPMEGIILPPPQADQRRGRPHLPDLRRRPAPGLPEHRAHPRPVQEDLERADSRRRHVRHRLHRAVVARDRPDLRPQAARRGDRQDLGRGPEAAGDSRRAARRGRSVRGPVSRARGVRHGLRHHEEPGAGAQPPQGVHLRQQRLRLQSVLRHAQEAGRRALDGR